MEKVIEGKGILNGKNNLNLYIKENDIYINIPKKFLENNDENIINDYIRIYLNIEKLKKDINKYLFDEDSNINIKDISDNFINIKEEENLDEVMKFINIDIKNLEEKLKVLLSYIGINIDEINDIRQEAKNNYINNSLNNNAIDKDYLKQIINKVHTSNMYSLKERSRYGSMSSEYNLNSIEEIIDFNDEEIGGQYCPILVIHRPAKYNRGSYVLDDTYYAYIKRQPLNALIEQERLSEKGIDGMGAITYIKLKRELSNENLQDIMVELYTYAQKNSLKIENIKLADITSNNIWLTADRLKKEYKELRYYNKNLTQKIKDIYDSTGDYYTQISGKYIFDSRRLIHCYNTFKNKDISK